MPLFLAQDLERTLIELLPWLVPVLIAVVAGIGRIMSELLERRVEKMRRFEEEGGGTKRPSVPRAPSDASPPSPPSSGAPSSEAAPPKPRRSILEEIRRYMEMMEERSLGDDRPGTGGDRRPEPRPETRRPTAPDSQPSPAQGGSRTAAEADLPRDARPTPRPATATTESSRPKPRPRTYSDFEGEVPADDDVRSMPTTVSSDARMRGSRLPAEMRRISVDDDPFAAFWNKKQVGKHSLRPRLDRRSARQAFVLAALLGRPRGDRPQENDPLGPFTG